MPDRIGNLGQWSDEELLLELITRGNIQDAPKKTTYVQHHSVVTVGIGNDHVAEIVIDDESLHGILTGQY